VTMGFVTWHKTGRLREQLKQDLGYALALGSRTKLKNYSKASLNKWSGAWEKNNTRRLGREPERTEGKKDGTQADGAGAPPLFTRRR